MAIRTTDAANRMASEAVLLTAVIREKLDASPAGIGSDTGTMAANLAGTLIATFGNSVLGRSLFEEVDDSEVAPATMIAEPPVTR